MGMSPAALGSRVLRTRWLVRAPIPLFRAGLGWVFGRRILLLEHRGRASGQRRFVCLEVVERAAPDRLLVVSGFGERAQWYRNLVADPRCFVSTWTTRRAPATARMLPVDEAHAALDRYRQRQPRDWQLLKGAIEQAIGHPVESLPMVELALDRHPQPQ